MARSLAGDLEKGGLDSCPRCRLAPGSRMPLPSPWRSCSRSTPSGTYFAYHHWGRHWQLPTRVTLSFTWRHRRILIENTYIPVPRACSGCWCTPCSCREETGNAKNSCLQKQPSASGGQDAGVIRLRHVPHCLLEGRGFSPAFPGGMGPRCPRQ